jgi:hypothetical protein
VAKRRVPAPDIQKYVDKSAQLCHLLSGIIRVGIAPFQVFTAHFSVGMAADAIVGNGTGYREESAMKKLLVAIAVGAVLLATNVGAQSRMCGDMNQSGTLNISDLTAIMGYTLGYSSPLDPDNGECDGRIGLTVGDQCVMAQYLFCAGPVPAGCPASAAYTFAPSLADTVFLPRAYGIPARYNAVDLPVKASLKGEAQGVYLVIAGEGAGSNGTFAFSEAVTELAMNDWLSGQNKIVSDLVLFNACRVVDTLPLVNSTILTLKYTRESDGLGDIVPVLVNSSTPLRVSVLRNGDLYVPVIEYYDFVILEPDTLFVSDSSLSFDAYECTAATTTLPVEFTSSANPITFSAQASDPWIWIEPPTTGLTTPATLNVTANTASLSPGVYHGTITLITDQNVVPAIETISVSLTVYALPSQGAIPGDFDCDGMVTMSDLTVLIDHLFINLTPLSSCK